MAQNGQLAQTKSFRDRVKASFQKRRTEIRSVSALARKLNRPRTSVSRAVNQSIFPELQKEIRRALKI